MANEDRLRTLRQGVEAWNKWRREHPQDMIDLMGADLNVADLMGADLSRARLNGAELIRADLREANLTGANLMGADLRGANLKKAILFDTNLNGVELVGADLKEADLRKASLLDTNLRKADLTDTDLSTADLTGASLVEATLVRTKLTGCRIYGISAWKLKLDTAKQNNLIITPPNEPVITVDNLEVAQFVYLLLRNEKIRGVIDTIAKKAVLILGRFTPERKIILDTLRTELRNRGYLPILFDFEKPTEKDFTETIKTLAGMSLFVIADISNPKSSPLELQATVPDYMVPFVPIIQKGEQPFSMFKDLYIQYKKWILEPLVYNSVDGLVSILDTAIIEPAMQRHKEILMEKAAELPLRYEDDYKVGGNKAP